MAAGQKLNPWSGKARRRVSMRANVRLSEFLSESFKTVSWIGNSVAGLGLLYLMIGKATNYIFEEELEYCNKYGRAAIFGGLTGIIAAVPKGMGSAIITVPIGMAAGPVITYLLGKVNSNISI